MYWRFSGSDRKGWKDTWRYQPERIWGHIDSVKRCRRNKKSWGHHTKQRAGRIVEGSRHRIKGGPRVWNPRGFCDKRRKRLQRRSVSGAH